MLSGCSSYTGLRKPLYDGVRVEPDGEAIAVYQESREIIGAEKEYYIRYPFSQDIANKSLEYPDEEPILLEEGVYIIGEDIAPGRVSLLGNESMFTSENNVVHVGNFIIRDEKNDVYFENLFHSSYGQLVAQVDLIEGHTIEIVGRNPEITVFYSETFPENPYVLMDPPAVLVNLDRLHITQPIVHDAKENSVHLTAGIYEVGVHLLPGLYEIGAVLAPHATELYVFHDEKEVRVFELLPNEMDENDEATDTLSVIELKIGDHILPSLVNHLELRKMD